jgi:hypothetical protein
MQLFLSQLQVRLLLALSSMARIQQMQGTTLQRFFVSAAKVNV